LTDDKKSTHKKSDFESKDYKEIIAEIDRFLANKQLHTISDINWMPEQEKKDDQHPAPPSFENEKQREKEREVKESETLGGDLVLAHPTNKQEEKDVGPDFSELAKKYEGHLTIATEETDDVPQVEHSVPQKTKGDKKSKERGKRKKWFSRTKESSRKTKDNKSNVPLKEMALDESESSFSAENMPATENGSLPGGAGQQRFNYARDFFFSDVSEEDLLFKDGEFRGETLPDVSEHIFFDELDDALDAGWSPKITDAERKSMALPPSPSSELDQKGLKNSNLEVPSEVVKSTSISLKDIGLSDEEWEELDFYPLQEPFAYVEILREKESLDKRYFLVEVNLTREEQRALDFIYDTMEGLTIDTASLEDTGDMGYLTKRIEQIMKDYDIELPAESRTKVLYYLEKLSLGLGKIDPVMKDPNIEDISCDGANVSVFLYHRKYGSLRSNIEFRNEEELSSFIFRLAQKCGKHISIAEPMLDATMPDGSRIQMTLSDEVTAKGSTFTIRKFREDPFSPPDLVEFNTMSSEMVAFMWLAVENGVNTLVAGGTAAGKTTVLNALSLFIPRESKIVSIEETRELNLPHPNWIPGVARSGFGEVVADKMVGEIDLYDLMKAALRQRPEYILVGEIRGKEAYVLFQAMATGHATYSTVHADSAQSLIHRLEGKPINIPRVMLQSLDLISLHVITRVKNKRARRCKQIIEIIDIDPTTKEILTNEVFRWEPVEDSFVYSGKSYVLERIRAEKDMSREEMTTEIRNRKNIIDWMNGHNIRAFRDVAKLVAQYIEDPGETLEKIQNEELNG